MLKRTPLPLPWLWGSTPRRSSAWEGSCATRELQGRSRKASVRPRCVASCRRRTMRGFNGWVIQVSTTSQAPRNQRLFCGPFGGPLPRPSAPAPPGFVPGSRHAPPGPVHRASGAVRSTCTSGPGAAASPPPATAAATAAHHCPDAWPESPPDLPWASHRLPAAHQARGNPRRACRCGGETATAPDTRVFEQPGQNIRHGCLAR